MNLQHVLSVGGEIPPSELAYIHNGINDPTTAFSVSERAGLEFRIPRLNGTLRLFVDFFSEGGEFIVSHNATWRSVADGVDVYTLGIPLSGLGVGLYFFRPRIITALGELFGKKRGRRIVFSDDASVSDSFQLSVNSFAYDAPSEMYGGIIYHIFVDRFMRGGKVNVPEDARIVSGEWETVPEYPEYPGAPLKNNTFYGGTLYGIIKKLDYIASLGTTAIYLSPIFTSVSNHKYDTADYMQVDEMFGGEEALRKLISECDKRNIKVILDGVFNHTGADSVYFNRYERFDSVGAFQSKNSKYYPWFCFKEHPNKYTCWWDIEILPRINPDIRECGEFFVGDGGVIDKYSSLGVYGFRLDVADELSDSFISKIKARLSQNRSSILYGEVWEDASNKIAYDKRKKYYLGEELDGVMNYPLRKGIIDFFIGKGTDALEYALTEVMYNAPKRIRNAEMNLLGTHDTERILTLLGGNDSYGKSNAELSVLRMSESEREIAKKRLLSAYTLLATLPGIPAVFYGDEAGLEGYHDPFNRMPYPWGREDEDILAHYLKIGKIRRENPVYREGDFKLYRLSDELLIFSRFDGSSEYLTVVNNSDVPITLSFSATAEALCREQRGRAHSISPSGAEIVRINKATKIFIV